MRAASIHECRPGVSAGVIGRRTVFYFYHFAAHDHFGCDDLIIPKIPIVFVGYSKIIGAFYSCGTQTIDF